MKKKTTEQIGRKKYELQVQEKMGADGVVEDHFTFLGATGKIFGIHGTPKARNVMSNADRKRLGLPRDKK